MKVICRRMFQASGAVFLLLSMVGLSAQTIVLKHATGQDVVPVFEGWERNTDGSFNMVFGYMNRNYEEVLDIPVGADNYIQPGGTDQGQPTHFYRRRQQFVFKVKVPGDWGQKDLVWTLTAHGQTEKAYAHLQPSWELGNTVYSMNRGWGRGATYPPEPDAAPSIEMEGSKARTVRVGEPLELAVEVNDDGYPKPKSRQGEGVPRGYVRDSDGTLIFRGGSKNDAAVFGHVENPLTQAIVKNDPGVRLGVTWVLYRGESGAVDFDPMRVAVVQMPAPGADAPVSPTGGKGTTKVTFSEPGTYQLRAYADDGILITPLDVTVNVKP